jgi:hypothetical protein
MYKGTIQDGEDCSWGHGAIATAAEGKDLSSRLGMPSPWLCSVESLLETLLAQWGGGGLGHDPKFIWLLHHF